MSVFDLGIRLRIAVLLCLVGSATAIGVLLYNHPVALLIFMFIGQPLLIGGMILYFVTVWNDLLHHQVFQGRRKRT